MLRDSDERNVKKKKIWDLRSYFFVVAIITLKIYQGEIKDVQSAGVYKTSSLKQKCGCVSCQ